MAAGTTHDVLRVRRWRNDVLVAADHPSPDRVRARIDDALRLQLGAAIESLLARTDGTSRELIFVRRLELEWTMDAARDASDIATACARAFARDLLTEIASPQNGNVVRFAGPAEYLSSYIDARSRQGPAPWFHQSFDGWATLPASPAIRSALCQDAGVGRAALRGLSDASLLAVTSLLESGDADEIVNRLAEDADTHDALREMLMSAVTSPPAARVMHGAALPVWLLARMSGPTTVGTLRTGCVMLRALEAAAHERSQRLADLLPAMCETDGPLHACAAAAQAGRPDVVRRIAAEVARVDGTSERPVRLATPFGGAFLLLDDLARFPWIECCAAWPSLETVTAVPLLQLVTLAHCLEGPRWPRVFADPFWRDGFRVAPGIDPAGFAFWLRELGGIRAESFGVALTAGADEDFSSKELTDLIEAPAVLPAPWSRLVAIAAGTTLTRFARRLPGFAASGYRYLQDNFLSVTATVEYEADRIVVSFSRPPLDLILRIAGLTRGERRWPWLDDRPFALFTGE